MQKEVRDLVPTHINGKNVFKYKKILDSIYIKASEKKDSDLKGYIELKYALLYYDINDFDHSIKWNVSALKSNENNKKRKKLILENLAYSYIGKRDFKSADSIFDLLIKNNKDDLKEISTYNQIRAFGMLDKFFTENKHDSLNVYFQKSKVLYDTINPKFVDDYVKTQIYALGTFSDIKLNNTSKDSKKVLYGLENDIINNISWEKERDEFLRRFYSYRILFEFNNSRNIDTLNMYSSKTIEYNNDRVLGLEKAVGESSKMAFELGKKEEELTNQKLINELKSNELASERKFILFLIGVLFATFLSFLYVLYTNKKRKVLNKKLLRTNTNLNRVLAKLKDTTDKKLSILNTITHELNTPLVSIKSFADSIINTTGKTIKEAKEDSKMIVAACSQLSSFILNIIEINKGDEGSAYLKREVFKIEDLLIGFKLGLIENENIEVNFETTVSSSIQYYEDKERIINITNSIVSFVSKSTQAENIKLGITLGKDTIESTNITLRIYNHGLLINDALLAELINPVDTGTETMNTTSAGYGLNVYFARKRLESMGGNIIFKNNSNSKTPETDVIVELKLSKYITCSIKPQELKEKAIKVLIVEDNKLTQKITCMSLKKLGITCDVANNGQEAIELFEKRNYDLILMDLMMPVMDGYAATQFIRKKDAEVKIFAFTAIPIEENIDTILDSGMNAALSKPIDLNVFKSLMNEHFIYDLSNALAV